MKCIQATWLHTRSVVGATLTKTIKCRFVGCIKFHLSVLEAMYIKVHRALSKQKLFVTIIHRFSTHTQVASNYEASMPEHNWRNGPLVLRMNAVSNTTWQRTDEKKWINALAQSGKWGWKNRKSRRKKGRAGRTGREEQEEWEQQEECDEQEEW